MTSTLMPGAAFALDLALIDIWIQLSDCRGVRALEQQVYYGLAGVSSDEALSCAAWEDLHRSSQTGWVSLDAAARPTVWSGPAAHCDGLAFALETAQEWLSQGAAEMVVLAAGTGQAAVRLLLQDTQAALAGGHIYALMDHLAVDSSAAGCAQAALRGSQQPVGYLLAPGASAERIAALAAVYAQNAGPLTCALDTALAVDDQPASLAALAALAQAAVCLRQRILPGGRLPYDGLPAPFYHPLESHTWFVQREARFAALHLMGEPETHIILREAEAAWRGDSHGLEAAGLYLFPLAGHTLEDLLAGLQRLQLELQNGKTLPALALNTLADYQQQSGAPYAAAIMGRQAAEVLREIDFAQKGLPTAWQNRADWQTPLGSFFTAQPLGRTGKVAFVYPGAFNSYLGLGKDLLYLFPRLHSLVLRATHQIGGVLREQALYPRLGHRPDQRELERLEAVLMEDAVAMLSSGTSLSVLYTLLLKEILGVAPAASFGYSLGENSMMFASGIWTNGDEVSKALADSDLFRSRIAGPQEAIREYWGLPKEASGDDLWRNYVLMTSPEAVRGEPDVYLTHINTPNQVVIGGRGSACLRLIERLRCNALEAPFRYALHCDPMRSERERLAALHDWPVMSEPLERLYTADGYAPLKVERAAIARSLAGMLVSPLDFVRLTNTVYQDGARIFIELGAGSNCSKWIGGTLKGQPHAALSLNRKGVSDYSALLGAVARLVGHRVPLRLEQVYGGSDGRMG